MKVIEVLNLSFGYRDGPILTDVGFSVDQGDFVAVIGANGAGKSTLLRLLLGELAPQSGQLRLLGQDVRRFSDWPRVGYVPQNGLSDAVGFPASAMEVVLSGLYAKIGPMRFPGRSHRERAMEALSRVGMEGMAKRLIGEMSGGQRQRVMLARVLVSDPALMLLDEPTTGVDAQSTELLYELLRDLNRREGLTVVMVTHDIARASRYVTRTLCLEHCSLVELEDAQLKDELSHRHRHPERHERTGGDAGGNATI